MSYIYMIFFTICCYLNCFSFFYQGQYPFNISLTEPLSDDITSGMAEFEGVEIVALKKMNPYTFSGFVPGN